jgi:REP element-mobilizing transposase RayT
MAQSLSKIYVHLIFSTKDRERTLPDEIRPDLHAYMGGTLKGLGCLPIEINTEPDHVHGLFLLARTEALSDVVGHLKKARTTGFGAEARSLRASFGRRDSAHSR